MWLFQGWRRVGIRWVCIQKVIAQVFRICMRRFKVSMIALTAGALRPDAFCVAKTMRRARGVGYNHPYTTQATNKAHIRLSYGFCGISLRK